MAEAGSVTTTLLNIEPGKLGEIIKFRDGLEEACWKLAGETCNFLEGGLTGNTSADVTVINFLNDLNGRKLLLLPQLTGNNIEEVGRFSRAWNRRCYIYLLQLYYGLTISRKLTNDNTHTELFDKLCNQVKTFESRGSIWTLGKDTTLKKVRDLRGVKAVYVTHLDSELFTTLLFLGDEEINQDLAANDAELKTDLWNIVRRELKRGVDNKDYISDDATKLWGIVQLFGHEKEDFHIGRHKGFTGAVKLAKNIFNQSTICCPSSDEAQRDLLTAEIFRPARTTLFMVKNGLTLLRLMGDKSNNDAERQDLVKCLNECIPRLIKIAQGDQRTMAHIYLAGLALETVTSVIRHTEGGNRRFAKPNVDESAMTIAFNGKTVSFHRKPRSFQIAKVLVENYDAGLIRHELTQAGWLSSSNAVANNTFYKGIKACNTTLKDGGLQICSEVNRYWLKPTE